jgi:maltose O-acetyltransferase
VSVREDLRRGFLINTLAASHALPGAVRNRLLRWYGVRRHPTAVIRSGFYFGAPTVELGRDAFVNIGCFFDGSAPIRIGAGVNIGMQVLLVTSMHAPGPQSCRAGDPSGAPIEIGEGCWIGGRATVLPGVSVAAGCVIAAGAVLTRDTEPNGLYAGVPARRVRDLDDASSAELASAHAQPPRARPEAFRA